MNESKDEREKFKARFRGYFDLAESPNAWGKPKFTHSDVESMWYGWQARAAGSAQVEGWVLAPLEPTPEMSAAGFVVPEAEHDPSGVYRAMLAAAPAPAAAQVREVVVTAPNSEWFWSFDHRSFNHNSFAKALLAAASKATGVALRLGD